MKATYTGLRDPEAEGGCDVHTGEEIRSFIDTFLSHWLYYLFILLLRILIWKIMWGRGLKLKCLQVKQSLWSPDPLPWRKHPTFSCFPLEVLMRLLICLVLLRVQDSLYTLHSILYHVFFPFPISWSFIENIFGVVYCSVFHSLFFILLMCSCVQLSFPLSDLEHLLFHLTWHDKQGHNKYSGRSNFAHVKIWL